METNNIVVVAVVFGFVFIVLQMLVILLDKHFKDKSLEQFNADSTVIIEKMKFIVDQTTDECKKMINDHIKEERQTLYGDGSNDMVKNVVRGVNNEPASQLVRGISLKMTSDQIPETGSLGIDGDQVYGYMNGHNGLSWYNLGPFRTCSVWNQSEDWIGTVDQFKLDDLHVDPDSWVVYLKEKKENDDE